MSNPNHTPSNRPVRTRFAPSPTGYLHLGGARTALYAWAFARHHQGQFILRIEDTDVERSTPEAVQAILDGMNWLQLDWDEGPFYQMQNMARYHEQIQHLLNTGHAYHCYCSTEELAQMREEQSKKGLKIRYDGRYRPEPGKTLPPIPAGVSPVVRFKNPSHGAVSWHDMVKGPISIANEELDDLIIARADGTPTYNFCVVVDDLDMNISHVIRGDDHINNTPRQINILKALGGTEPSYGHIPMILGPDGEKLSKRHGTVSVIQYHHMGFLPDAMVNYLARLGWAHGDDEIFSRAQLIEWFDGSHLSKSSAQFDPNKLAWVNAHYLKQTPKETLVNEVLERLNTAQFDLPQAPNPKHLNQVLDVVLERANTLQALCEEAALFYRTPKIDMNELQALLDDPVRAALLDVATHLAALTKAPTIKQTAETSHEAGQFDAYSQCVKTALKTHQLKMPKLAMPLRLIVTGKTQTPSIDAVLALVGPKTCIERINTALRLLP